MDLRWQHLRHWSGKKERKSETVTATDPRGEREKRDIIKLLSRNFLPPSNSGGQKSKKEWETGASGRLNALERSESL